MALGDGVLGDILPDDEKTTAGAIGFLSGKVKSQVKDDSAKLSDDDIQDAVVSAIEKYSKVKPYLKTVEVPGTGVSQIALPAEWVKEFSGIEWIEYPVGQDPESILENSDDYGIYKTPDGEKIRFKGIAPAAEAAIWITFTVMRDETTIPLGDVRSIVHLAASLCFEQLANRYVDGSDSTIQADSVNYRTKSQEAASRAKALRKLFSDHMGIKEDEPQPAASFVADLDLGYPGGGDRLTHRRRDRERR